MNRIVKKGQLNRQSPWLNNGERHINSCKAMELIWKVCVR